MRNLDARSRLARAEHAWMEARRALHVAYERRERAEALGHQHAEAEAQVRAATLDLRAAEREVDDRYLALFRADDALHAAA